jgi:hypothetical protein
MENLLDKVKNLKRFTKTQIKVTNLDKFITDIQKADVSEVLNTIQNLLTDEYNKALIEVEYLINATVNDNSPIDYGSPDVCGCGHAKGSHHTGGLIRYGNSTRCVHCPCTMYLKLTSK